jgi:hypothetical protein
MKIHLFHDWTKWEFIKDADGINHRIDIFDSDSDKLPVKSYYRQTRECLTCGMVESRRIYR